MTGATTMEAAGIPAEISQSLGSVWKNYSGERPSEVSTTIRDTRIVCVMNDGVKSFDAGIEAAAGVEPERGARPLTMATYRRDAIEAVTRITRRRVLAFICNHDAKTGVAKEVFIIDSPPSRMHSIFIDRQGGEE